VGIYHITGGISLWFVIIDAGIGVLTHSTALYYYATLPEE